MNIKTISLQNIFKPIIETLNIINSEYSDIYLKNITKTHFK